MKRVTHKSLAFTIIELMIVIVILGILSAVAIVAYSNYKYRARQSEGRTLLADIRIKQEAYRSTFHQYANPRGTVGWMPNKTPAEDPRQWTSGASEDLTAWNQLGVRPDGFVYFSYYCIAGLPGDGASEMGIFSGVTGIEQIASNDFWYAARAVEDLDGDGLCEGFDMYSGKTEFATLREASENCPQ